MKKINLFLAVVVLIDFFVMETIWEVVVGNGIFACLFVWLLFYQLKDSAKREKKYIDIIDKLAKQFDVIEDVKEDVKEIKKKLFFGDGNIKNETKVEEL